MQYIITTQNLERDRDINIENDGFGKTLIEIKYNLGRIEGN